MQLKKKLYEKFKEAVLAVLPIVLIVSVLSLICAPIPSGTMLSFLLGGLMLVIGMMFFSVGAEVAMEPMGEQLGAKVTATRNLKLVLILGLVLGTLITVAEPDLQVLAKQVQSIPDFLFIISVGIGVGLFLLLAIARILYGISLHLLLVVLYSLVLGLAFLAPESFRSVAFDSGGVTTGPMTVPFIMSFGMGIAAIRSDKKAYEDSFGLVALCSIGPIPVVLILSMIFKAEGASYVPIVAENVMDTIELRSLFSGGIPIYLREMLISILPITVCFFVLNHQLLHLSRSVLSRIGLGILYTYVGLTIFMTGANYGFMPAGAYLGQRLGEMQYNWVLIPICVIIGYLIVRAEPAVYVLMRRVEDITDGEISGRSLKLSLCISVGISIGLSIFRIIMDFSLLSILIPGYLIAILLSFICPKLFMSIAFDAGGVASGPMTVTFLLPMTIGFCTAQGENIATDAFGVVAMIAMTPLITIQCLGILYRIRHRHKKQEAVPYDLFADLPDDAVIDL